MHCIYIYSAVQFMPLIHTHIHTPTAIGSHARYQPTHQEQLGVRCLAQGHFDTPRVGSNRQPSDCQTTALTSWAISKMHNQYTHHDYSMAYSFWHHTKTKNLSETVPIRALLHHTAVIFANGKNMITTTIVVYGPVLTVNLMQCTLYFVWNCLRLDIRLSWGTEGFYLK